MLYKGELQTTEMQQRPNQKLVLYMATFHLLVLFLIVTVTSGHGSNIITTLPGYNGNLTFKLETGYIGVGESETSKYFYYYVESQRSPDTDPLLLWISGSSCSSLHALLFETGPIFFKYGEWHQTLDLPQLFDNPYAWTKNMSVIYLDGPIGSGFSYSELGPDTSSNDTIYALEAYEFLEKWLIEHESMVTNKNPIYIGGDGYTGMTVPLIIQQSTEAIDNGTALINFTLTGYVLGNPGGDTYIDFNSRIPFGNMIGLIPEDLFESANTNCNGNFTDYEDPNNHQCAQDVAECKELLENINSENILEAACGGDGHVTSPATRKYLREDFERFLALPTEAKSNSIDFPVWCRKTFDKYADTWANREVVQDALHVRKGKVPKWITCKVNESAPYPYVHVTSSVVHLHAVFSQFMHLRALIYSGDHDMVIPYIGTQQWIKSLELPVVDKWRAWSVDNETAGYTRGYAKNNYTLTYATVKGAGHLAPQYKVKECSQMIDRWMSHEPL